MKLWLVIYSFGHIGGVAGPLPYDMGECIVRRDEMRQQQTRGLEAGIDIRTGTPMTDEQREGVANLEFECEYRDVNPELGESK